MNEITDGREKDREPKQEHLTGRDVASGVAHAVQLAEVGGAAAHTAAQAVGVAGAAMVTKDVIQGKDVRALDVATAAASVAMTTGVGGPAAQGVAKAVATVGALDAAERAVNTVADKSNDDVKAILKNPLNPDDGLRDIENRRAIEANYQALLAVPRDGLDAAAAAEMARADASALRGITDKDDRAAAVVAMASNSSSQANYKAELARQDPQMSLEVEEVRGVDRTPIAPPSDQPPGQAAKADPVVPARDAAAGATAKADPVIPKDETVALVKRDLVALSSLGNEDRVQAGEKMTKDAVADPGYRQALQNELDAAKKDILVDGAELARRREEKGQGVEAPPAHPYAAGYAVAQLALQRAESSMERAAKDAEATPGYAVRHFDQETKTTREDRQPTLEAAIVEFNKLKGYPQVTKDGKEIISIDPEDNRVLTSDKDVQQTYDKVIKSLEGADKGAKAVDVRKDSNDSREAAEGGSPKKAGADDKEKDDKEFITPEALRKRYIEADNKFYFRDDANKLAFEDTGKRLATDHNDPAIARSMVELAEAKKWTTIKVKGADEFKREVWLQASMRGMQVQGYKPTDVDLAKLEEQRKERTSLNSIEQGYRERQPERDTAPRSTRDRQVDRKPADNAPAPQAGAKDWAAKTVSDPGAKKDTAEATDKKPVDELQRNLTPKQKTAIETLKAVLRERGDSDKAVDMASRVAAEKFQNNRVYAGKIVEHGEAPYENDPKNDKSYYVKLDTPAGEKEVWGVDLKRAMEESKSEKGDVVAIAYQGNQQVTIPVKERDDEGKLTGKQVDTVVDRNTWDVSKLEKMREDAKARMADAARNTDRKQPVVNIYDRAAPRNAERAAPVREQGKDKDRQPEHAGRG
jgi:hypothetical protein